MLLSASSLVAGPAPVLARKPAPCSSSRSMVVMKAQAVDKHPLAKFSDSIGMPTDEGYFGFKPFSEVFVGRLSMLGFISSIVGEFVTGRGTLGQIGITGTPSTELLIALSVFFTGITLAGTAYTVNRVLKKDITRKEVERYKTFLGMNNEDDWMAEAKRMKKQGDFTTPGNNMAAIQEAKLQGTPADKVLGTVAAQPVAVEASVAVAEKPEQQPVQTEEAQRQKQRDMEELMFGTNDLKFARDIELTNGRWAMMGFLAAILVEAGTGKGIILQIIMYLKWSGILGPMSGF